MSFEIRDQVIDCIQYWSEKTELAQGKIMKAINLQRSKFYDWRRRYGKVNEHNSWIPRDHWIEDHEKSLLFEFYKEHPREGYRRLAYMMIDADVVAMSPSSVYRILKEAGLLNKWSGHKHSSKGQGFNQPLETHEHWHVDISYINISGTFFYLCSVLDGYSRYIVHWEIREAMKEKDVEIIIQRAKEKYPEASPRIISDNGPQFIAKDFKDFIRLSGMSHVRTSPYYPQSNGKIERWHKSLKQECIRPKAPNSLAEARKLVENFVGNYNNKRLHSSIGYITPKDMLEGKQKEIFSIREEKMSKARTIRKLRRERAEPCVARLACAVEPGTAS